MGVKKRHPTDPHQEVVEVQGLAQKENIHQTSPFPKPRVRSLVSGPLKASVAQPVEEIWTGTR
eukprot:8590268-Prorocentrum_lima.AAC.1